MESVCNVGTHPLFSIAVGGAAGSVLRYVVGQWVDSRLSETGFPFGTFTVNFVGSFILGVLAFCVLESLLPNYRELYLLFGTGFCGGFTTFSTFEWETHKLIRDGNWWLAGSYVVGSVVCGFIAFVLAGFIVQSTVGKPLAGDQIAFIAVPRDRGA
jgi:fluoride exporter